MGNAHSASGKIPRGGGGGIFRKEPKLAHAFSVRVSVNQPQGWLYLQYIRPNGQPVWCRHKCNYISRISHFSSAQRICREIFTTGMFPSGTRVQFHKQFFEPSRTPGGEVSMKKLSEKPIKQSTVLKP